MRRAFLLVVCLLVAGCSEAPEAHAELAVDPDVDDVHGAVAGIVLDETLTPLAGVEVRLSGEDRVRVTAENGTFQFSLVEAGSSEVSVAAEGFLLERQRVDVVAGATATVRFVLERDTSIQPYAQTFQFKGFVELGGGPAGNGMGATACECDFSVPLDMAPVAVVVEMYWDNGVYTNNVRHAEYTVHIEAEGITASQTLPNPFYWNVEEGGLLGVTDGFTITVSPDEQIPALQQEFTLLVTPFYVEGPAPGWRATGESA